MKWFPNHFHLFLKDFQEFLSFSSKEFLKDFQWHSRIFHWTKTQEKSSKSIRYELYKSHLLLTSFRRSFKSINLGKLKKPLEIQQKHFIKTQWKKNCLWIFSKFNMKTIFETVAKDKSHFFTLYKYFFLFFYLFSLFGIFWTKQNMDFSFVSLMNSFLPLKSSLMFIRKLNQLFFFGCFRLDGFIYGIQWVPFLGNKLV